MIGAQLVRRGTKMVVIETNEDCIEKARRDGAEILSGNAADPDFIATANLAAPRRLYVIDWTLGDGVRDIPIERRDGRELSHIEGRTLSGALETVAILPRSARWRATASTSPRRGL